MQSSSSRRHALALLYRTSKFDSLVPSSSSLTRDRSLITTFELLKVLLGID
jgi:hypothetical protein